MLWLCTFNMNLVTSALFLTLSMLFFFIAGGQQSAACLKFAGYWGIMVSCIAFYAATSMLMEEVYGRVRERRAASRVAALPARPT
jgi:succinate-acetate transporter protein